MKKSTSNILFLLSIGFCLIHSQTAIAQMKKEYLAANNAQMEALGVFMAAGHKGQASLTDDEARLAMTKLEAVKKLNLAYLDLIYDSGNTRCKQSIDEFKKSGLTKFDAFLQAGPSKLKNVGESMSAMMNFNEAFGEIAMETCQDEIMR